MKKAQLKTSSKYKSTGSGTGTTFRYAVSVSFELPSMKTMDLSRFEQNYGISEKTRE